MSTLIEKDSRVEMEGYKSFIGINLPISLIEKVKSFQKRYRFRSKTEAYEELLRTALFVESKIGIVDSMPNEELENIKEQLEMGQIVDYFAQMDNRKFSILINILRDEEKIRGAKRT